MCPCLCFFCTYLVYPSSLLPPIHFQCFYHFPCIFFLKFLIPEIFSIFLASLRCLSCATSYTHPFSSAVVRGLHACVYTCLDCWDAVGNSSSGWNQLPIIEQGEGGVLHALAGVEGWLGSSCGVSGHNATSFFILQKVTRKGRKGIGKKHVSQEQRKGSIQRNTQYQCWNAVFYARVM